MRTLIRDVRVFDGERVEPKADVLVEDDVIAVPGGEPDSVVEGTGRTLMPGLIDAHTHVFDGSLAQALAHGVTTELDMFCLPDNLTTQRRLAAERDDVADLRSAGVVATSPGGHPSQIVAAIEDPGALGDAVGEFETVAGADDARGFVERRVAEGVDYLKVIVDDGELHGTRLPTLTPDVLGALVAAAHSAGLKVIAHALTGAEVEAALDAGVDGLAHVWVDSVPRMPRLAARIADQGVFVVSTLAYYEAITAGVEVDRLAPDTARNAVRAAAELRGAGASVLAGTDATPFAPAHGEGMHRELQLLVGAGYTAVEALAAATSVPARHFGLGDRGRIAVGLRADLVLVEGDPTSDITATSSIVDVWRRGVRQER